MTELPLCSRPGSDKLQETERRLDFAHNLDFEPNGDREGLQELMHRLVPSDPGWVVDYLQPQGANVDGLTNLFNDDRNDLKTMPSTMPNRSASWPPLSEQYTFRDMGIRPSGAESHKETEDNTIFSSRRVPSHACSSQCVACLDHVENPGAVMMKIPGFVCGGHEAQSSDAIPGSLDAPEGQALSQIDVTQAPAFPTISEVQLNILQGAHYREFPKQTTYQLEGRTWADSRGNSPIISSGPKRTATQASQSEGFNKRTKTKSNSADDVEEASCDEEILDGQGEDSVELDTRSFACPFYRRFPIQHKDCINRKLSRIRDIKQHILRRHIRNPIYCPTCYKSYGSLKIRDEHIRSRRCLPRRPPVLDGHDNSLDSNSNEVQDLFKYRANRALSAEKQWHEIWDILFKDGPKARNAYLGTVIEETVGIIRDFWEQKGLQMTPAYLTSKGIKVDNDTDIRGLMMGLFDEVQRQFEQRTHDPESSGVLENEQSSMAPHNTVNLQDPPTTSSPEAYSIHAELETYVHVEEAALTLDSDGSHSRQTLSPVETCGPEDNTAFLDTAEQAQLALYCADWFPSRELENPFIFEFPQ